MENTELEYQNSPEVDNSKAEALRRLGATTLSAANFDTRHKEIVDSSFNKARENGEKLPGKNNERRNYAYLSRLEKLIDKHGNKAEKKLWGASIKDDLLVKYDNIPESYWQSKRQELRDNCYGNIELTDDYKHRLFNKERELQKESLEKWANYLGDKHSPYPLWFKVYAWDGMTKMGKYDKAKGKYATRNEATVAPYPNLDAEVLGGVFEVVNRYYGNNDKEFYTEEGERNIELEKIVQSGNFAKIYNAIQHNIAPIIEPPEKAEDVHGDWVEYSIDEEDDIARAARGTGWCVASPSVGRHYLEYGTYGEEDEWDDEQEDDEDYDNEWDNKGWNEDDEENSNGLKSKFILFHLEDPSTGKLSKNAVASIRLDPDGQVAEISGLKEGQALNDSLISIVEEKVKTLPGGEKFLEAFADKQELIRLDRKMQNNEDLTKEELEFIYELNRPIKTLDTYNNYDPRVPELKEKYGIEYALNAGIIDADNLVSRLRPYTIANNLDTLLEHGTNIDNLVSTKFGPGYIVKNLDTLIKHGANIDIDNLVSRLDPEDIADNLDSLLEHGASINIDSLVSRLDPYDIADNLDTLLEHGASIDMDSLVSELSSSVVADNLDSLLKHSASIDNLVSRLDPYDIADNLDTLIEHGASIDIDSLVSELSSSTVAVNLDTFIEHGANIDNLVSRLSPSAIADNLDTLIEHGASINIDSLVSILFSNHIVENLDALIKHGANIDIDNLVSELNSYEIAENLDTLIKHGANINIDNLVSKLDPEGIKYYADTLRAHGWQG